MFNIIKISTLAIFIFTSTVVVAQPINKRSNSNAAARGIAMPPDAKDGPIDKHITFLLLAAITTGVIYKNKHIRKVE